jgi:lipopolysaccharide export LptBFGC system permease protein LptF
LDLPPITPEVLLWLGVPLLASVAAALGGIFVRRRSVGTALVLIGLGGFVVSVLWILLALRVEAVVQ